jgi:hypothetical protein
MMIVAASVVAAATIGGGVTYLATSHTAQATAAQAAPMEGHGRAGRAGRGGHGGGAGGAGMLGKIEHGEFTTASAGVMQVQRGAITAIDSGSVTVRSTDGFTASYTITPTTAVGRAGRGHRAQAPAAAPGAAPPPAPGVPGAAPGAAPGETADVSQLQTGDTVQVLATKTDTGSTATRIAPTRA